MPREIKTEPFIKNGHAGVIGSALSIVRYQDANRNVAQYLLGDVVVVDTMDTALYLWNKDGFSKTVVTLAGEIVDPWGAVTGGAVDTGGSGMLTKRREIKDLEQEVAALKSQISGLESELTTTEASIGSDTRTSAELSQQVHRMEIELVNGEKDCIAVKEAIGRSTARAATLGAEASERATLRAELATGIEQAAATLRSLRQAMPAPRRASIPQAELSLKRKSWKLRASRSPI
jgi:chromosome segregation protein